MATVIQTPSMRPLVVDLDGTLVHTDLLMESVFALARQNALLLFLLPVWLLRGKAHLKQQIAARVDIDASSLPYHAEFLDYLREQHASGRRLVLATAANEKFAHAISTNLGLFDDVLASDTAVNLCGGSKLERVRDLLGDGGFDYAANAKIDLALWEIAGEAVLVNPERGVRAAADRHNNVARVFDSRTGDGWKHYLEAMRLHQWLKNLLLFVPLVTAHQITDPAVVGQALTAFLAFGLCASSVYLLNDLLDLSDDRRHPTKRLRPFAAGTLPVVHGAVMIPLLLLAAFSIALVLPPAFLGVLAIYYTVTMAYSLKLKRHAPLDVLTLASLYTLRIIAGAAAISVEPSFWLLAFSMFLFLSLALVKRYTELWTMQQLQRTSSAGRGYRTADLETLSQFGTASGYMAVLVLALYVNSPTVQDLYTHPQLIWLLCPLLLYLVTRIWLLARRDELHEDPVIFVIRDRHSLALAAAGAVLLWLAA